MAGQHWTALKILTEGDMKILGVEVRFRGAARATWRETVYSGTKPSEVEREKEEIYFDDRFCLWGRVSPGSGWDSREVLQVGRHIFPFQYRLPTNVPCSFEGISGSVRYTMQGIIIRPNGEHLTTDKIITVLKEIDLRKQGLKEVLEDHAERAVRGACCRPGRVFCSLTLAKRHFVAGEAVPVTVQVNNRSIRRCGQALIKVKQLITYGSVHRYSNILVTVKLGDVIRPGQSRQWRNESLMLPSTCPTVLDTSQLITVAYCIALEVNFPDASLYAAVPVTVTSIPDYGFGSIRWKYEKSCFGHPENSPSPTIQQATLNKPTSKHHLQNQAPEDPNIFIPKYKHFTLEKDKTVTLSLAQSPGVRRRRRVAARDQKIVTFHDEATLLLVDEIGQPVESKA